MHNTPDLMQDVLRPCLGASLDHVGLVDPFADDDAITRAMIPMADEMRISLDMDRRPLNLLVAIIQQLGNPDDLFARVRAWLDRPNPPFACALVWDVTTGVVPMRHTLGTGELERMCKERRIHLTTLAQHKLGVARALHHAIATLVHQAHAHRVAPG
jgi:hypothetical protein